MKNTAVLIFKTKHGALKASQVKQHGGVYATLSLLRTNFSKATAASDLVNMGDIDMLSSSLGRCYPVLPRQAARTYFDINELQTDECSPCHYIFDKGTWRCANLTAIN